eukprot:6178997-Lingulodinium_polyedra.AAC.1
MTAIQPGLRRRPAARRGSGGAARRRARPGDGHGAAGRGTAAGGRPAPGGSDPRSRHAAAAWPPATRQPSPRPLGS